MNKLDRTLARYAPGIAARREVSRYVRAQFRMLNATTGPATSPQRSETRWRGASRMLRSLSSWVPQLGSGRTDLPTHERERMIARSNDAYRGHMVARAAVTRVRTAVIGTGIIPHANVDAQVLGLDEEQATKLNETINREWARYAENPLECDAEASLDHYAQQLLVEMSAALGGDMFALTPFEVRPGCTYGLKVQLIDGVRVSNPTSRVPSPNLIDGVEMDALGAPVRYHIRRRHPDEHNVGDFELWDAVEVFGAQTGRRRAFHVMNDKERIAQVRGVPFLAPILEPLQGLETYGRAELFAAVVSSMFTVFLKKEANTFGGAGNPLAAFSNVPVPGTATPAPATNTVELGHGAVVDLAPGETAELANPTRPNSNFDPFFMAVCTQMGAALEIPVDELLLRYQTSYSAARAAMLQAWRMYTLRRQSRVQQFCSPVRELWFDEAVARGIIPAVNYSDPQRRAAYVRCIWIGPARGAMDERQEAEAAEKRISVGLSNETMECAAMMGEAWSDVRATRERELARRRRAELQDDAERYGAAVRAGVITPQPEDEQQYRSRMGLPEMSQATADDWQNGAPRRPITLQSANGSRPFQQSSNAPNDPNGEKENPGADPLKEQRKEDDEDDENPEENPA